MSFFSKVVENKAVVIGGVIVLAGLGILYKNYVDESKQQEPKDEELNLEKEIAALKKEINVNNPSLDDVKRVLSFSTTFAKRKVLDYSRDFKRKRRQFTKASRKEHMTEYMNLISNGMEEVQNIALNLQQQILKELGINEMHFQKYQHELGAYMQQLMMGEGNQTEGVKAMSIDEVKYAIRLQIEYIRENGEQVAGDVIEATKSWSPKKKAQIPMLISVVIADGAFEDHEQIDQEAVQMAEMKMQRQLMPEMQQLQQVMAPMMMKLSSSLQGSMGGMGGMGGMDMGMGMGMDMEGGMGMTAEQMQQLQQLQQLRLQNPAAFEEMMQSMYGGFN